MKWLKATSYISLFALYSVLALGVIPTTTLSADIAYWINWAAYIRQHGLSNAYELTDNNYNPLFQYVLWLYLELIQGADIAGNIGLLKVIVLTFDVAGAMLAASFAPARHRRFVYGLLLLLNAGYVYNTLVWGQVDAMYSTLTLAALVLSLRERPVWSVVLYVLALNAKTQAIVFLPVLLLLWVPQWTRRPNALPAALVAGLGLQLLLLWPFVAAHSPAYLPHIVANTLGTIEYYRVVSMYCSNVWSFLLWHEADLTKVPDALRFAGLTYRTWGILFFLTATAALLLPLLRVSWRNAQARRSFAPAEYSLLLLSAGLVPVMLAYFNTEMHSRYAHAAIMMLGAYAFASGRYALFVVASVAYFLNLTAIVNVFAAFGLQLAWNPQFNAHFIASLYTLVVVGGLREVYRLHEATRRQQPAVPIEPARRAVV